MKAVSNSKTDESMEQLYAEARKRPPLSDQEPPFLIVSLGNDLALTRVGLTRDVYSEYKQCNAKITGKNSPFDVTIRGLDKCKETAMSKARPLFSWAGYKDRRDYTETQDRAGWTKRTYSNGAEMRYENRGSSVIRWWIRTPPPPPSFP